MRGEYDMDWWKEIFIFIFEYVRDIWKYILCGMEYFEAQFDFIGKDFSADYGLASDYQ